METERGTEGGDRRRAPGRPAHDVFAARLAAARARQQSPVAGTSAAGRAVAATPTGPDLDLVHPAHETRRPPRPAARHRRTEPAHPRSAPAHRTHRHRSRAQVPFVGSRGLPVALVLAGLGLAVAWLLLAL